MSCVNVDLITVAFATSGRNRNYSLKDLTVGGAGWGWGADDGRWGGGVFAKSVEIH